MPGFGLVLLLLLFLIFFLALFLFLLAVLLFLLLSGGAGLCGLQGFFQALGGFVGLALGIDGYLYLVLDGGFDTSLFECGLVILGEHEGGVFLSGLPCDVPLIRFAVLVFQTGNFDRAAARKFRLRLFGEFLFAEGLGDLLIGGLFL